jgi:hypothetical protein
MSTRTNATTIAVLLCAMGTSACDSGSRFRTESEAPGPAPPSFGAGARLWESYWYSRYNLGALVMQSGTGDVFMPDMNMVQAMTNLASDDLSEATPPRNPALLRRVFDVGDPRLASPDNDDPMDFGAERWFAPPAVTTSEASFGWTLLKETQWARQFHVDEHFGRPERPNVDGIPGAQERFAGLVLYAEALMQGMLWLDGPELFDAADPSGRYVALMALADLTMILTESPLPHSVGNRYRTLAEMMMAPQTPEGVAAICAQAADDLFVAMPAPATIAEHSLAVRALSWYTWASSSHLDIARSTQRASADYLSIASATTPTGLAQILRGLVEASRALAEPAYLQPAARAFSALAAQFDESTGHFTTQQMYTVDDIAEILGALNELLLFGGPSVSASQVDLIFTQFFHTAVNLSGLQLSAPPVASLARYEQDQLGRNEILFRYPPLPVPRQAGGPNGTAPVFAASVAWDPATRTWWRTGRVSTPPARCTSPTR